ncbi:MAG: hypothetical protein HY459_00280 [Parcubacteria group bacterium]|nr:hypothetical protein [Parcubacteria group bacterium]
MSIYLTHEVKEALDKHLKERWQGARPPWGYITELGNEALRSLLRQLQSQPHLPLVGSRRQRTPDSSMYYDAPPIETLILYGAGLPVLWQFDCGWHVMKEALQNGADLTFILLQARGKGGKPTKTVECMAHLQDMDPQSFLRDLDRATIAVRSLATVVGPAAKVRLYETDLPINHTTVYFKYRTGEEVIHRYTLFSEIPFLDTPAVVLRKEDVSFDQHWQRLSKIVERCQAGSAEFTPVSLH